ncbi:MAG: hypothetical protein HYS80_02225 [Candidatus Aenigmarchaeota archaeon]|nr:hypothetical protein [Candidatus Aenigmarchaeota archaeon]
MKCSKCKKTQNENDGKKYTIWDDDAALGFFCKKCSIKIAESLGFKDLTEIKSFLFENRKTKDRNEIIKADGLRLAVARWFK